MTKRLLVGLLMAATGLTGCGGSHHPCRAFPVRTAAGLLDNEGAARAVAMDTGRNDRQGYPVSVVVIRTTTGSEVVLGHSSPDPTSVQSGFWVAMDTTSADATGFPETGQPSIVQDVADAAQGSVGAARACL